MKKVIQFIYQIKLEKRMKKLSNKKLFSDLRFATLGGIIYLFLSLYLTSKFSLSVNASFLLTVVLGAIFMLLNAMKINNVLKFKR
jgi:hypothetical protein